MNFEAMRPDDPEVRGRRTIESQIVSQEVIRGPIRRNHLITTKLGIEEATPILEHLNVVHKVSLLTPEMPLGTQGAVAPAEYRIEIMDHNNRAASEEYVLFVFDTLRQARVPVQRVMPEKPETEALYKEQQ